MSVGQITYYTYDLMAGTLLAELPFYGVTWSQQLNASGQWSGSLNLADPRVAHLNALTGTRPSRTLLIVDVDGVIVFGGIVWARPGYDSSQRVLQVNATEAWSYFTDHRVQAADYTVPPTSGPGFTYWTANPASADYIAAAVVADAITVSGSAFSNLAINIVETIANVNPITESYPLTQVQSVGSIVQTLANGGYLTGFDFAIDWAWSGLPGSTPKPTLNLTYPRRGRIAGTTGLVIDASVPGSKYVWPEDGTQQAGVIYGTASGAGGASTTVSDPGVISAGYPLLEAVVSYSQVNTASGLQAAAQGDLARLEWPVTAPSFTAPMFGPSLAIGDFLIGDDSRVVVDPDERFPNGLDTYLRIVGLQANPADVGQSLMTLTLGLPPALAPVAQPPS